MDFDEDLKMQSNSALMEEGEEIEVEDYTLPPTTVNDAEAIITDLANAEDNGDAGEDGNSVDGDEEAATPGPRPVGFWYYLRNSVSAGEDGNSEDDDEEAATPGQRPVGFCYYSRRRTKAIAALAILALVLIIGLSAGLTKRNNNSANNRSSISSAMRADTEDGTYEPTYEPTTYEPTTEEPTTYTPTMAPTTPVPTTYAPTLEISNDFDDEDGRERLRRRALRA